jgi:uncharacterized membrane protein YfcA
MQRKDSNIFYILYFIFYIYIYIYMYIFLTEIIFGLISGIILSITGIPPFPLITFFLDYFKIGDPITNLGTIVFLNLFPNSIGGVYQFYKNNKINYLLCFVLFISTVIGSFLGSNLIFSNGHKLSLKNIKYITSGTGFVIFIIYLFSAYYEKN